MPTDVLSQADIREIIRFAIGQAPAGLFARTNMKSPDTRLAAVEQLTDLIASRFAKLSVSRELRDGWHMP